MHCGLRLRLSEMQLLTSGPHSTGLSEKINIGHIYTGPIFGICFFSFGIPQPTPNAGASWSREITRAAESMIPVLSFQSNPGPAKNINEKKPRAPAYISTSDMPSFPQIRLYPDVSTSSQPSRMCDSVCRSASQFALEWWLFFFFGLASSDIGWLGFLGIAQASR